MSAKGKKRRKVKAAYKRLHRLEKERVVTLGDLSKKRRKILGKLANLTSMPKPLILQLYSLYLADKEARP